MADPIQDGDGAQALDTNEAFDQQRNGVVSGVDVSPGTNALTVQCTSGTAVVDGSTVSVSAQDNVAIPNGADPDDPKKAVVYVDAAGTLQVQDGTPEAADPSGQVRRATKRPAPDDMSGVTGTVCAEVWVGAGVSDISSGDVSDRRPLMVPAGLFEQDGALELIAEQLGSNLGDGTPLEGDGAGGLQGGSYGSGVPSGGILMHDNDGASLPTGYVLCDGNNGTPDLRGGYVKGASGTGDEGTTGGANTVTLTESEMPSHKHGVPFFSGSGSGISALGDKFDDAAGVDYNVVEDSETVGGGSAHQNEPVFTELRYMMKT